MCIDVLWMNMSLFALKILLTTIQKIKDDAYDKLIVEITF